MFNFIVENPISTLKTFPTNISTSFPQLQYTPIFSNFFCKFFPTLNCGINFYLCGENLYVFIFIILSQLFFQSFWLRYFPMLFLSYQQMWKILFIFVDIMILVLHSKILFSHKLRFNIIFLLIFFHNFCGEIFSI